MSKVKLTFTKYSVQWLENYIALRKLAFERSMERFDIYAANIACAQREWAEQRLLALSQQGNP